MDKNSRIYIAGHTGFVGSALTLKLQELGFKNLILRNREELNLLNQNSVNTFFQTENIDYVFFTAGNIGGIYFNQKNQVELLYENTITSFNTIHAAAENNVKKFLFLSSSCFYPKDTSQPIKEEQLLTDIPEPTNEGHAIAKIAGSKLCQYYNRQHNLEFITAISTNIYGKEKEFHPDNSHVIPALFYKFIEARKKNISKITLWGNGEPKREFIYIDDITDALIFLMNNYSSAEMINVGTGNDISIYMLAMKIKALTNYEGDIIFDTSHQDGMKQKLLDITKIRQLGWSPATDIDDGLSRTYLYCKDLIEKNLL